MGAKQAEGMERIHEAFKDRRYDNKLQWGGGLKYSNFMDEWKYGQEQYVVQQIMSDSVILVNNLLTQGGYFWKKRNALMSAADFDAVSAWEK